MKEDKNKDNNSVPGVDPALEKKVDALMSVEPEISTNKVDPKTEIKHEFAPDSPTSAPLLPTDKLPNLAKDEEVPAKAIEEPPSKPVEIPPNSEPKDDKPSSFVPPEKLSVEDKVGVETPATNRAVEEIEAEEAGKALAKDLKDRNKDELPKKPHGFLYRWWHNKIYRRLTYLIILIAMAILVAVPSYRYFILNTFGVRASASMTILDSKTKQPLKNVEVRLGGQEIKTGIDGVANFNNIKLGKQDLVISKPAFAQNEKTVVIGWGSNPMDVELLEPVGSRYTFSLSDFVSDLPIAKAEAISGEASAVSNDKGQLVLTVPNSGDNKVEIAIRADNYKEQKVKLPANEKQVQKLKLVPSRKDIYVSNRSGNFDVYISYVDGTGEEKILSGTGSESESTTALVPHPFKQLAAYVSVQGKLKDNSGNQLSTLSLINIDTKQVRAIATSKDIQVVGWSNNKIIYVKIADNAKDDDTKRSRLMSYDSDSSQEKELSSTNYFNSVLLVNNNVYYTPASFKVNGKVGLFKIGVDGSGLTELFNKEVWGLLRTSYGTVSASVGENWYEFKLGNNALTKATPPPVMKSRVYIDNESGNKSLWIDQRDGKGVLLEYSLPEGQDTTVATAGGLRQPARWLDNNHIIYRKSDGQETANYVVSVSGGKPKKINDVANVASVDSWYYF